MILRTVDAQTNTLLLLASERVALMSGMWNCASEYLPGDELTERRGRSRVFPVGSREQNAKTDATIMIDRPAAALDVRGPTVPCPALSTSDA